MTNTKLSVSYSRTTITQQATVFSESMQQLKDTKVKIYIWNATKATNEEEAKGLLLMSPKSIRCRALNAGKTKDRRCCYGTGKLFTLCKQMH
jgi:hypothetical protein